MRKFKQDYRLKISKRIIDNKEFVSMNNNTIEYVNWFNAMVKFFLVRMNCKLEPLNNKNTPNIKIIYLDF